MICTKFCRKEWVAIYTRIIILFVVNICYLMRNVTFLNELYYYIIVCEVHTYIQYVATM